MKTTLEFIRSKKFSSILIYTIACAFFSILALIGIELIFINFLKIELTVFLKQAVAAAIGSFWVLSYVWDKIKKEVEEEIREKRQNTIGGILQSIRELDAIIAVCNEEKTRKAYVEFKNNLQRIVDSEIVVYAAGQILKNEK